MKEIRKLLQLRENNTNGYYLWVWIQSVSLNLTEIRFLNALDFRKVLWNELCDFFLFFSCEIIEFLSKFSLGFFRENFGANYCMRKWSPFTKRTVRYETFLGFSSKTLWMTSPEIGPLGFQRIVTQNIRIFTQNYFQNICIENIIENIDREFGKLYFF